VEIEGREKGLGYCEGGQKGIRPTSRLPGRASRILKLGRPYQ
jgi:hypothetical protein